MVVYPRVHSSPGVFTGTILPSVTMTTHTLSDTICPQRCSPAFCPDRPSNSAWWYNLGYTALLECSLVLSYPPHQLPWPVGNKQYGRFKLQIVRSDLHLATDLNHCSWSGQLFWFGNWWRRDNWEQLANALKRTLASNLRYCIYNVHVCIL